MYGVFFVLYDTCNFIAKLCYDNRHFNVLPVVLLFAQAYLQGAFARFTLPNITSVLIRRSVAMAAILSASGGSGETSCDSEVTKT